MPRPGVSLSQHASAQHVSLLLGESPRLSFVLSPLTLNRSYATKKVLRRSFLQSKPHFNDEPNIDPDSLRNTLKAHQQANRGPLIQKVDQEGKVKQVLVPAILQTKKPTKRLKSVPNRPYAAAKQLQLSVTTQRGSNRKSEHGGAVRQLAREWRASQSLGREWRCPWLAYIDRPQAPTRIQSAMDRLAAELRAFDAFMTPTEDEEHAAHSAIHDIQSVFRSLSPEYRVDVIGSRATGLAGPLADLDLNILARTEDRLHYQPLAFLKPVYQALVHSPESNKAAKSSNVTVNHFIGRAMVPIIGGVHTLTELEFQVQSAGKCYESMEYIKTFATEFPTLRPLSRVVKQMLSIRQLCIGSQGGLTYYPLLNMVLAALKFSHRKYDRTDIAAHFLFFLDMYSQVDFYNTAITISPAEYLVRNANMATRTDIPVPIHYRRTAQQAEWARTAFMRKSTHWPYAMSLQDPADPMNNLGKSAYMIKDVQATIIDLRQRLLVAMDSWNVYAHNKSEVAEEPVVLSCLLEGDYRGFIGQRNELARSVSSKHLSPAAE